MSGKEENGSDFIRRSETDCGHPSAGDLYESAQDFKSNHQIKVEYDLGKMASTMPGKYPVLFVYQGPSEKAVTGNFCDGGIWNPFKKAGGKFVQTLTVCNYILKAASAKGIQSGEEHTYIQSLDEVYLMDLYPWKIWRKGERTDITDRDKELSIEWFANQVKLISPDVVIFFAKNTMEACVSGLNRALQSELESSTSNFSTSPLSGFMSYANPRFYCKEVCHPGALRYQPFKAVEEYIQAFTGMNAIVNNLTDNDVDLMKSNVIANFRDASSSIISILYTTCPDELIPFYRIKNILEDHNMAPGDSTLRALLEPYKSVRGGGKGRPWLYKFDALKGDYSAEEDFDYEDDEDDEDENENVDA
eukprot:gene32310-39076_t